jgi:hypothetical protein
MIATVRFVPIINNKTIYRIFAIFAILVLLFCIGIKAFDAYSQGGAISELLVSRSGTSDSNLYLTNGTGGNIDIGMGGIVSTGSVTGVGISGGVTTATLHGNLSSLNGMPTSEVYFKWGYAAGALVNETAHTVKSSTGDYTIIITGYDPTFPDIFYQSYVDTDGTSYGSIEKFHPGDSNNGITTSIFLLWLVVSILLFYGIIFIVFAMINNSENITFEAIAVLAILLVTMVMLRIILQSIW